MSRHQRLQKSMRSPQRMARTLRNRSSRVLLRQLRGALASKGARR
jgi:hypothetical protein